MNSNEIKRANRKALPKFILIMVICMLVGGVAGFCAARYGLNTLSGGIKEVGTFFGAHIAPWLMVAVAVAVPVACVPIYKGAKQLLSSWDGENEAISDAIDQKLSVALWITSTALILSYFLIAASYSGGFEAFEDRNSVVSYLVGIVGFLVTLLETIVIQQRCVDTTKKMNPEKTASVFDPRFQKKWMDSCDEAERIMIGRCALKAHNATNTVCAVLAPLLAVCALVFEIGLLPSFVVCLIWIIDLSVYCKEALRCSKAGNKLS